MDWQEGTPVGDYQISQEIAQGSKGVVYAGLHIGNREPALLVVLQRPDIGQEGRGRGVFLYSMLGSIAELRHPAVASIKSLWKYDDLLFIVSEFPQGKTALESFGRPPLRKDGEELKARSRKAAAVIRDVAGTLHEVHGQGFAHQDLRPEDIILREDGGPIILGLGWASLLERSKEAKEGGPERDLFASGLILYRLITGRDLPLERVGSNGILKDSDCIPRALGELVGRALGLGPPGEVYHAGKLSRDLDDYLYPVPVTVPKGRPGRRALLRTGLALGGAVAAILLIGWLASFVMTGYLPDVLRSLSVKTKASQFMEHFAAAQRMADKGVRTATMENLLAKTPGLPGTARARADLGRLYVEQGRWEDALGQFLMVRILDPSVPADRDLLDLAERFHDAGRTALSDWILDKVIHGYEGGLQAWKALLLKNRVVLERGALHDLAASLEDLMEGPLKRYPDLMAKAARLADRAGSISLKRYPLDEESREPGSFLQARPEGEGDGAEFSLRITSNGIEVHEASDGRMKDALIVKGRPCGEGIMLGSSRNPCLFTLPVQTRYGLSLALLEPASEPESRKIDYMPLGGRSLVALLAADLFPETGSEELLAVVEEEHGSRIIVLGLNEGASAWEKIHQREVEGRITCVALLHAGRGEPSRILIGLSTRFDSSRNGEFSHGLKAGVYSLERSKALSLIPLKVWPRGTVLIRDAVTAPAAGREPSRAFFLVHFPGYALFEPETRILVLDGKDGFFWLHCPGALELRYEDPGDEPGGELIIAQENHFLGVRF